MPPLPSVPNALKLTIGFALGDDAAATSRLHFAYTGTPPDNAACLAFATTASGAANTYLKSMVGTGNSITSVSVLDLSSPSGGFGIDSSVITGSRGSGLLAAGTAVLLSMAIARRYRGGKPRAYFPFGITGDLTSANQWASGSVAAFLDAINNFQVAMDGQVSGGCTIDQLINISYYEGFTGVTNPITGRTKDVAKLRTAGPVVDVITGLSVNTRPASQRRRNLTV